ncbi:MAG: hypothetical protein HYZ14_04155 [Bacteroidetes bacterium]|nr:hypothetical protein [Bacteroidota bacterium]
MSIVKMHAFHRTRPGRIICYLMALAIFNLNSCTFYKSAETNLDYVKSNRQILENLDTYKFYVHDPYGSYLLQNPVFNPDGSISGNLSVTAYQTPDSTWSQKERKTYWQNHKYDIGIYTSQTVADLRADLNGSENLSPVITIQTGMIERMTITSIDKEGELGAAALVLLIVLGVIVAIGLLIILITVTVAASSDGVNSSSDGSSDGSGSGSNGSGSSG